MRSGISVRERQAPEGVLTFSDASRRRLRRRPCRARRAGRVQVDRHSRFDDPTSSPGDARMFSTTLDPAIRQFVSSRGGIVLDRRRGR